MSLTNLVLSAAQSVTLITNVTSGDNSPQRSVQIPCPEGMIGCLVYHSKLEPTGEPPTEKWVATNVVAQFTLTFDWIGQERTVQHAVHVWGVTNHYRLRSEWESFTPDPNRSQLRIIPMNEILLRESIGVYSGGPAVFTIGTTNVSVQPLPP